MQGIALDVKLDQWDVRGYRTFRHISSDHDVVTYRDFASYRERRTVPDPDVVADAKSRLFGVANSKSKTALSIDGDIVSYNQQTSTLDPVNEYSGMYIASMISTVRFKKRLTHKNTNPEVIQLA